MAATVIRSSTGRQQPSDLLEVLIDSADDLESINPDASPGSKAYTANGVYVYTKDNDGTWKRTISASGGGASPEMAEAIAEAIEKAEAAKTAADNAQTAADNAASAAQDAETSAGEAQETADQAAKDLGAAIAGNDMAALILLAEVRSLKARMDALETQVQTMAGS